MTWMVGQASEVSAQSEKAVTVQSGDSGQSEDSKVTVDDNSSHRSVNGRFLTDMRSPIAVSVGVWDLYAPSLSPLQSSNKSTLYTLIQPGILLKRRKRESELNLDYEFGYRRDNTHNLHTSDHSARVDYVRQMSRNFKFQVSDAARSVFNDFGFLPDASGPSTGPGVQQLYVPRQRTITNTLMANMNYRAGKRSEINMFSTYDVWRYRPTGIGNLDSAQVGVGSQSRINKWLFLDNRFSHFFTINSSVANQALLPGNIDSLHAGGLTFQPRKTLNVSFAGGGELVRLQTGQRKTGSLEASVARKSRSSLIAFAYHRGFSTAAGATLNGQTAGVSLNQNLSRRLSFQVSSSYTTGTALTQNSKMSYLSANAGFDVTILRNLVFSSQYTHVSQNGANLPVNTPVLKLQTATAGLRFFLPPPGR
jgi:hypothetical protein